MSAAPPAPRGADRRAAVAAEAVASVRRFALLPEVTLRIVDIVSNDAGDAAELKRAVSTDPVLCLRLLKVANSAFYGLTQPVTSVDRAIVLLGGEAVRNIALAASFGRLADSGEGQLSAHSLWQHSLAVAAAAAEVAKAARYPDPGEAFLAGLLHDIGFIVQMQRDAQRLLDALSVETDRSLLDLEDEAFGANHQDFGRELCAQWQLPESIGAVLSQHHEPASGAAPLLGSVVAAAESVSQRCGLVFSGHAIGEPVHAASLRALGLTESDLEPLAESLPDKARELQRVLSR